MNGIVVTTDLAVLAVEINTVVHDAETHAKSAMQSAMQAGALLNTAKAQVQHGEWEAWLEANCDVAVRTAQAYMRLAKNVPLLSTDEAQRVADLPVREAVRAIATAPETPPRRADLYFANRSDRERFALSLRSGANALIAASRDVGLIGKIKNGKVDALRKKLTAAIEALDEIAAGGPA